MFNKKFVFFAVFVVIVFIMLLAYLIISNIKQTKSTIPQAIQGPSPASLQTPPEEDYSSLNKVIPGKATLKDVERINGKPQSAKAEGDRTFLYYLTPLENFTNTVVLDNNIVTYSIENVFGPYRGTVQSLKSSYGEADFTLYGAGGYFWRVYLRQGFVVETDRTDIATIVYFVPQNKVGFMSTIAKEFQLQEEPPEFE